MIAKRIAAENNVATQTRAHITRRPRGSLVEPKKVLLTLEGSADNRLSQLAGQLGVTKSALAQFLIETVELDERSRVAGFPRPATRQEEFDIAAA